MTKKIQTKLPQATLTAWIEALKLGVYKQGYKNLGIIINGVECHCTLGVLCELLKLPRTTREDGVILYGADSESENAFLPVSVREATGLTKSGRLANVFKYGQAYLDDIVGLNDHRVPRELIAKIIEENFLAAA